MSSDKEWLEQHGVVKEHKKHRRPEHGFWSTGYLGANFLFAGFNIIMLPTLLAKANNQEIDASVLAIVVVGLLVIAQLVTIIDIWKWKRRGLYGFIALTILSPIIETVYGIATVSDYIAPFIQLFILWVLFSNKMKNFR